MRGLFNLLSAFPRVFFDFILYQSRYKFLDWLAIGPEMFGYFDTGFTNNEILFPALCDGAALCARALAFNLVHFCNLHLLAGGYALWVSNAILGVLWRLCQLLFCRF